MVSKTNITPKVCFAERGSVKNKNVKKRFFVVLEVSRNDAQHGELGELDEAVPNRNPDGETSLQLPVHLNENSATVVYANHTVFVKHF